MAITKSFVKYLEAGSERDRALVIPSAIISDGGVLLVPIFAVTTMTLTETFSLPPLGTTGSRAIAAAHDDTISLTGVLPGAERFAWKLLLESLAEAGKRGSALQSYSGGRLSGLILVTSMTIRTDMQIQSLTFTASATRRDALDVTISLAHMPRPGALAKLLDVASLGVAALADWGGN
jgi:hypothetical protein